MIIKILAGVALLIVVLAVVVAMRPSDFRVTRSTAVSAPPAVVFAQVNELRNWEAWSPWVKLDPAAKQTYEGPAAGLGAIYRWVGNRQVGEGSMTVIDSRPSDMVRFRLDFIKPFAGTCTAEFTFKPEGSQTIVFWSMMGKNNFMAKAMGLFMNCEKMVGGQFEQGLAQLKAVTEGQKTADRNARQEAMAQL